jgi:hypothetical protein
MTVAAAGPTTAAAAGRLEGDSGDEAEKAGRLAAALLYPTPAMYPAIKDDLLGGRYRVQKFLGRGVYGTVVECVDTRHPKSVHTSTPILPCAFSF